LIEWIRDQGIDIAEDVLIGVGDDMAVVRVGGEKLLITTDMLLEGVHFELSKASLAQVGYKAMACSLSDCAAMAALPFVAVVAVGLPRNMSMQDAQKLHLGIQKAAKKYNCPVVGGDVTSWDKPLTINVSMLARTGAVEPVLRSGAKVGDSVLVTGTLGGSLLGRHLEFEPRVTQARQLAELVDLHAMIDISDALSSDLGHICQQSGVSAVVDAEAVPISDAAKKSDDPLTAALGDGEDFELLFCLGPEDAERLLSQWPGISSLQLSCVGQIIVGDGKDHRVFLRQGNGQMQPMDIKGWEHFSDG